MHQHFRVARQVLGRLRILDLERHVAAEQFNVAQVVLERGFVERALPGAAQASGSVQQNDGDDFHVDVIYSITCHVPCLEDYFDSRRHPR